MFGVGQTELMVVALVALLLFGNRLPKIMRSMGQGITEFKRGLNATPEEIEQQHTTDPN
jgi:sec-independent protein translocase protein TatA